MNEPDTAPALPGVNPKAGQLPDAASLVDIDRLVGAYYELDPDPSAPEGTEDVYKIYAESFLGAEHLDRVIEEAQVVVHGALA